MDLDNSMDRLAEPRQLKGDAIETAVACSSPIVSSAQRAIQIGRGWSGLDSSSAERGFEDEEAEGYTSAVECILPISCTRMIRDGTWRGNTVGGQVVSVERGTTTSTRVIFVHTC